MITEEMLREAAHKAGELIAAYYERGYDPQKQPEFSPEFEKRMQDIIDGKLQDSEMRFAASSEDGCLRDNK